jgi:hypothetical protein
MSQLLSLLLFLDPILEFWKFCKERQGSSDGSLDRSSGICTSAKALSEPQLPSLWLVCGALGRISMRLTCATWCCWAKDRIQEEASHATWSRCASVWNIFVCFSKYSLLLRFSSCFYFGGGSCFIIFLLIFLCPLIGALFLLTPLSFCKYTRKEISLELWSIYFWWVDGMFCVTPSVEVSLYMWVYVILIMGTWKDSTKGHNNLEKLNESQSSICRRFILWYQNMALVGDMTIEELVLFYFLRFSAYYEIEQDSHCRDISY